MSSLGDAYRVVVVRQAEVIDLLQKQAETLQLEVDLAKGQRDDYAGECEDLRLALAESEGERRVAPAHPSARDFVEHRAPWCECKSCCDARIEEGL